MLNTDSHSIPWGEVGYPVFKRTYARPVGERTEEWPETVERVIKACNEQLGCNFNDAEQQDVRHIMLNLKGTVAGRFLWQLGTETVDKLGLPSLQNCAFVVVDEEIRPFTWAFEGMSREENLPLLGQLVQHATRPEFCCRFRWQKGSIAFWDNRATWHWAMNDYHGERRLMHRITIEGCALN